MSAIPKQILIIYSDKSAENSAEYGTGSGSQSDNSSSSTYPYFGKIETLIVDKHFENAENGSEPNSDERPKRSGSLKSGGG